MKKLIILFFLLIPSAIFAADSCTVAVSGPVSGSEYLSVATLTCDGNSGATAVTAAHIRELGYPSVLYAVETIPGTGEAEPSTYTVAVTSEGGTTLLSLSARSATVKEIADASEDLGFFPPITGPISVTLGDLGASNTTVVKLIFY